MNLFEGKLTGDTLTGKKRFGGIRFEEAKGCQPWVGISERLRRYENKCQTTSLPANEKECQ